MSRDHIDPRRAPRHTGDAWSRGYEYRPDQNFTINFGPFFGVRHEPSVADIEQTLRVCADGIIRGGSIWPVWIKSTANITGVTTVVYPPKTLWLDGEEYLVVVTRGAAGNMFVNTYNDVGTETNYDTGISIASDSWLDFTAYGNDIYIVHSSGADIVVYDRSAGTDTTVASSPDNGKLIFVLDNNMVVVHQTGNVWEVSWAVDGAPTDWTSIGSGNTPLPKEIGEPVGYAMHSGSMLICGTRSAVRMTPTGTLPAFSFALEPTFPGIPTSHSVQAQNNAIFYVSRDFRPSVWINGQVRLLSSGQNILTPAYVGQNPIVSVASELNAVAIGSAWDISTSSYRILFYDTSTLEVVAEYDAGASLTLYAISDNRLGIPAIRIFSTNSNVSEYLQINKLEDTTTPESPTIETHVVNLGHRVHVQNIELLWQREHGETASAPDPTVTLEYTEGVTSTIVTATRRDSSFHRMRYDLSTVCDNFRVKLTGGTWSMLTTLKQIKVYCATVSPDDIEVLG